MHYSVLAALHGSLQSPQTVPQGKFFPKLICLDAYRAVDNWSAFDGVQPLRDGQQPRQIVMMRLIILEIIVKYNCFNVRSQSFVLGVLGKPLELLLDPLDLFHDDLEVGS